MPSSVSACAILGLAMISTARATTTSTTGFVPPTARARHHDFNSYAIFTEVVGRPKGRAISRLLRAATFRAVKQTAVQTAAVAAAVQGLAPDAYFLHGIRLRDELNAMITGAGRKASTFACYETWFAHFECFVLHVTDIIIETHGGVVANAFPPNTPAEFLLKDRQMVQRWAGKYDKVAGDWEIEPDDTWNVPFSLDMYTLFVKYFTKPIGENILPGFCKPIWARGLKLESVTWVTKSYSFMLSTFGRNADNPAMPLDGRIIANHRAITTLFDDAFRKHTTESTARATSVSAPDFDVVRGLPIIKDVIFSNDFGPFPNQPLKQMYVWFLILAAVRIGFRFGDMGKIPSVNLATATNWVRVMRARRARQRAARAAARQVSRVRACGPNRGRVSFIDRLTH